MDWFETLRLPPYHLERVGDQYELTFEGTWPEVMLWEIPALSVLMELRSRAVLHDMGRFEIQVLYARAMTRLWEKIERLRPLDGLRIADFGTRRRHSYLWQDWCVQAMREGLGDSFIGTSNCLIAKSRDLEAIGTNAHELPMVYAALADGDTELARAPYDVLADWHEEHEGNLRMILPDTYGTPGFLDRAPDWLATWTGIRIDSGDPATGAEAAIRWWKERGEDPTTKLIIFSDGLDVDKVADPPPPIRRPRPRQLRLGHAADQRLPRPGRRRPPGPVLPGLQGRRRQRKRATVKLSDNPRKAMGPEGRWSGTSGCLGLGRKWKRRWWFRSLTTRCCRGSFSNHCWKALTYG